jgi:hypothetical protein
MLHNVALSIATNVSSHKAKSFISPTWPQEFWHSQYSFFLFYQTRLQVKRGLIHSPVSLSKYKRPRWKWSSFDYLEIDRLNKWRQPLVALLKHSSNALRFYVFIALNVNYLMTITLINNSWSSYKYKHMYLKKSYSRINCSHLKITFVRPYSITHDIFESIINWIYTHSTFSVQLSSGNKNKDLTLISIKVASFYRSCNWESPVVF